MPAVVRDFDGLEGEEERLLAIVRARRGVGVGDLDRRLAALRRGVGVLDQRKSERVERAVGLHGLGPVAEIGVLRRVWVFIRRGIQALSAPDGIALAPHAELVVRPGAGVARQRHAVKERARNAVVRGKPAQAAAVPPRVPFGRSARAGAAVDGIVEVGRHVPPVDPPGVAVDGPAHAVPLEHDAPSVVRQRGRHVLRRRIRAGMIHRRERLPRRRGLARRPQEEHPHQGGQSPPPASLPFFHRDLHAIRDRSIRHCTVSDSLSKNGPPAPSSSLTLSPPRLSSSIPSYPPVLSAAGISTNL